MQILSYTGEMNEGVTSTLAERSANRRKRIETHRAASYEDAERWDLAFWQSRTAEERLSALPAIHRDIEKVRKSRLINGNHS